MRDLKDVEKLYDKYMELYKDEEISFIKQIYKCKAETVMEVIRLIRVSNEKNF